MGNKYGPVVLPIELSTTDFNNIKNIASDLNKGKNNFIFILKLDFFALIRC